MRIPIRNAVRSLTVLAALAAMGCRHADMSNCADAQTDGATLVAACSAAIQSGRLGEADSANAYLARARGYLIQKNYDPAIADLDALLLKQPGNVRALGYRGGAHANKRELDLAYSDYLKQTELVPNEVEPWIDLGRVNQEQRDYPKALEKFAHAIALKSDSTLALNGRCQVRAIIGTELDEALADCDRSLKIAPDNAATLNIRGFVNYRRKDYAAAIHDLDASIAQDPSNGSSYYLRGIARLATGQVANSDDIARGKSLEPGVADRYAGYGVTIGR